MPLLLIQNDSTASASKGGVGPGPHHGSSAPTHNGTPPWKLASNTSARPASGAASGATSQTAALPSTAPATTVPTPARTPVPAQEVAQRVVVTRTTVPVTVPPTTAPPPVPTPVQGSIHYGQVTYYAHPAGRCASPFLPFGTVVQVTNPANGASATCVVDDREADTARSIDLATSTFAALAPLSQGVIDAQLRW